MRTLSSDCTYIHADFITKELLSTDEFIHSLIKHANPVQISKYWENTRALCINNDVWPCYTTVCSLAISTDIFF